ncbi:MAG: hypothetical protein ACRC1M_02955, partial [Methanobacteriaceae archaeon]
FKILFITIYNYISYINIIANNCIKNRDNGKNKIKCSVDIVEVNNISINNSRISAIGIIRINRINSIIKSIESIRASFISDAICNRDGSSITSNY